VERYPAHLHGDNGQHRYADAEAVRLNLPEAQLGPAPRLRETWQRYGRPIAVTEVHHGCTRDEQLRWFAEVWNAATKVRAEGADVRAVTLWSMFGTVDWNTLLTECNGVYEPGAFDTRGPKPRRTALARAAASLARDGAYDHPVLDLPGWWHCGSRYYLGAKRACRTPLRREPRRLLMAGGVGALDQAFSRACGVRGIETASLSQRDMADAELLAAALDANRAWAVINLGNETHAAQGEGEQAREAQHAKALAEACRRKDVPLVTVASDLVFDGRLGRAYRESDPVSPASMRGARTAQSERQVLAACPDALIFRAGRLFAPGNRGDFVWAVLQALTRGRAFRASLDVVSTTYAPDFAHVALDLVVDGETGIWHLPTPGEISWHDLALAIARRAGLDVRLIAPCDPGDAVLLNSALTSERGLLLPPLPSAIDRYLATCEADWRPAADVPSVAAE
jgi:dTDP-4-dehydrorhamnose reductase